MGVLTVRGATDDDDGAVAQIAHLGDADTPPSYLAFVRSAGRLLVAERDGRVLGFGGMVPVGDGETAVAMVTDLFVHPQARGRGIGTLLLDHLLRRHPRRMTCSSSHPAALPAYVRVGMEPRGRVRYWRGRAQGGGPPVRAGRWAHDRLDLIDAWAVEGATVTTDTVFQVRDAHTAVVYRVMGADPVARVEEILRGLPAGVAVTLCVPEWQPLGEWLKSNGFDATEHDLWCATPGVDADPLLAVVHPGLW